MLVKVECTSKESRESAEEVAAEPMEVDSGGVVADAEKARSMHAEAAELLQGAQANPSEILLSHPEVPFSTGDNTLAVPEAVPSWLTSALASPAAQVECTLSPHYSQIGQ